MFSNIISVLWAAVVVTVLGVSDAAGSKAITYVFYLVGSDKLYAAPYSIMYRDPGR